MVDGRLTDGGEASDEHGGAGPAGGSLGNWLIFGVTWRGCRGTWRGEGDTPPQTSPQTRRPSGRSSTSGNSGQAGGNGQR